MERVGWIACLCDYTKGFYLFSTFLAGRLPNSQGLRFITADEGGY